MGPAFISPYPVLVRKHPLKPFRHVIRGHALDPDVGGPADQMLGMMPTIHFFIVDWASAPAIEKDRLPPVFSQPGQDIQQLSVYCIVATAALTGELFSGEVL
jgi:hypothetical protein